MRRGGAAAELAECREVLAQHGAAPGATSLSRDIQICRADRTKPIASVLTFDHRRREADKI